MVLHLLVTVLLVAAVISEARVDMPVELVAEATLAVRDLVPVVVAMLEAQGAVVSEDTPELMVQVEADTLAGLVDTPVVPDAVPVSAAILELAVEVMPVEQGVTLLAVVVVAVMLEAIPVSLAVEDMLVELDAEDMLVELDAEDMLDEPVVAATLVLSEGTPVELQIIARNVLFRGFRIFRKCFPNCFLYFCNTRYKNNVRYVRK